MYKKILIDLEKIKDPYSGLGQFCLQLKKFFDHSHLKVQYFIPKRPKLYKYFPFLIPKCDIFHALHQDCPYVPFAKKTKYILTIHDLNALYEEKRERKKQQFLKELGKKIKRANHLIFISEFTKSETMRFFSLENKNSSVIYNGHTLPEISALPLFIPAKKFLFSIGTIVPKKNIHTIIEMMAFLPDFHLVIAGTTFHLYAQELIHKVQNGPLKDQITFVGTISNEEKRWYFEHTEALLFPSLLEGFGIPVAEAQSLGVPLFLSKLTSLPEVGGPLASYFDSFVPENMAKKILTELPLYTEERKRSLIEYSHKFDFKNAFRSYQKIYESI